MKKETISRRLFASALLAFGGLIGGGTALVDSSKVVHADTSKLTSVSTAAGKKYVKPGTVAGTSTVNPNSIWDFSYSGKSASAIFKYGSKAGLDFKVTTHQPGHHLQNLSMSTGNDAGIVAMTWSGNPSKLKGKKPYAVYQTKTLMPNGKKMAIKLEVDASGSHYKPYTTKSVAISFRYDKIGFLESGFTQVPVRYIVGYINSGKFKALSASSAKPMSGFYFTIQDLDELQSAYLPSSEYGKIANISTWSNSNLRADREDGGFKVMDPDDVQASDSFPNKTRNWVTFVTNSSALSSNGIEVVFGRNYAQVWSEAGKNTPNAGVGTTWPSNLNGNELFDFAHYLPFTVEQNAPAKWVANGSKAGIEAQNKNDNYDKKKLDSKQPNIKTSTGKTGYQNTLTKLSQAYHYDILFSVPPQTVAGGKQPTDISSFTFNDTLPKGLKATTVTIYDQTTGKSIATSSIASSSSARFKRPKISDQKISVEANVKASSLYDHQYIAKISTLSYQQRNIIYN
ncbi:hypothetical protein [Secundilactobacillus folii]|uniref:Uncharacterized protein n=1 Tax=Secundilactobacillus folii TaxID=2678357 RepID=A0A7X2XU64_9LACO|nr:hypothetical protein [Secundilactobacillus folii]MTV81757.1 hypothetical protein [Secundilactobacillus folii]